MQNNNLPNNHFEMPSLISWWKKQHFSDVKFKIICFLPSMVISIMSMFGERIKDVENLAINDITGSMPWYILLLLVILFFMGLANIYRNDLPDYSDFKEDFRRIKNELGIKYDTIIDTKYTYLTYSPIYIWLILVYSMIVLAISLPYNGDHGLFMYTFAPIPLIAMAIYAWYQDNRWHTLIKDIKQNGIDHYLQEVKPGKP